MILRGVECVFYNEANGTLVFNSESHGPQHFRPTFGSPSASGVAVRIKRAAELHAQLRGRADVLIEQSNTGELKHATVQSPSIPRRQP